MESKGSVGSKVTDQVKSEARVASAATLNSIEEKARAQARVSDLVGVNASDRVGQEKSKSEGKEVVRSKLKKVDSDKSVRSLSSPVCYLNYD